MNRITLPIAATLLIAGCATEPDCSAATGFKTGLNADPADTACEGDDYHEAYRIGQTLGEMRSERDSLLEREEALNPTERMRLRVLERDIPEVETLARMQGLMDPAPPPKVTDPP